MEVYFDNSSTTKMYDNVIEEVVTGMKEYYGNPSSLHNLGLKSERKLKECRSVISEIINAEANEVHFNSGGSEGNNLILKGVLKSGSHLITTPFEHASILNTLKKLEEDNVKITFLKIDKDGRVDLEHLKESITKDTALVSIMHVNNEIGTIEPVKEIGKICRERKVIFHTDAVQAVGNVKIDVKDMNIDLLSLAGHKVYGPKGIGALYIRKGIRIDNLIHGGGQERARRAGTENIPAIVGLGKAMEIAGENLDEHIAKISKLRDKLIKGLLEVPFTRLNGPKDGSKRLPGNVNVCFEFIEGEGILLSLDFEGVCASSGSACTSGSLDPSHVLLSIGLPHEKAHGSLRLTLGDGSTEEDVNYVIEVLPPIIQRLRDMSPLWEDFIKRGVR